jgi:hypothetical protein
MVECYYSALQLHFLESPLAWPSIRKLGQMFRVTQGAQSAVCELLLVLSLVDRLARNYQPTPLLNGTRMRYPLQSRRLCLPFLICPPLLICFSFLLCHPWRDHFQHLNCRRCMKKPQEQVGEPHAASCLLFSEFDQVTEFQRERSKVSVCIVEL